MNVILCLLCQGPEKFYTFFKYSNILWPSWQKDSCKILPRKRRSPKPWQRTQEIRDLGKNSKHLFQNLDKLYKHPSNGLYHDGDGDFTSLLGNGVPLILPEIINQPGLWSTCVFLSTGMLDKAL